MAQRRRAGFTLIELLIVIAIIGILAVALMPGLFAARTAANERAAQMYSASIHKALTAVLAASTYLSASDVVGGTYNCGANAPATTQIVVDGRTYAYGWSAAPSSVTGCNVSVNATGGIDVEITTATATFVSGVPQ